MNFFDDELEIVRWLQNVETSSVLLMTNSPKEKMLYESVCDEAALTKWTASNGKSDPPPDFYNVDLEIMLDVMRVDDHAHKNMKGKVVNPVNQRESIMQKEIRDSGILEACPNVKNVMCNPVTDLSTEEDHNYGFYLSNFQRVIEHHNSKIPLYRENHSGYKTAFWIFDESTAYIHWNGYRDDGMVQGQPHCWFADKAFLNIVKATSADYIIWHAPFKLLRESGTQEIINLPAVNIIDVKNMNVLPFEPIEYDPKQMVSSER